MNPNQPFWSGEPVSGTGNYKPITYETKPPITLPPEFTIQQYNSTNLLPVIKFIQSNYIGNNDSYYLFYTSEFIEWYLTEYTNPEYTTCLYHQTKLIGFISAAQQTLSVKNNELKMLAVNFLCLDLKYRNKKLAPLLIQHITHKANLANIFIAIFTGGIKLPFNFTTAKYFHRPLNARKLIEIGFLSYYEELPINSQLKLKLATQSDLIAIKRLYYSNTDYLIYEKIPEYNFKHFLPRKNVIITFVDCNLTQFITFYFIETRFDDNIVKSAYIHYWQSDNIRMLLDASFDLLINEGIDMVNVLGMGRNFEFVNDFDFLEGSGSLNYSFYNFDVEKMASNLVNYSMF